MLDIGLDEWRIRNMHCTAAEIEERQAVELVGILDRWQSGEMRPCDVLLQTAATVGRSASCEFLFDYQYYRDCSTDDGARARVLADLGEFRALQGSLDVEYTPEDVAEAVQHMREKYRESVDLLNNVLRPEVFDESQRDVIYNNIADIRRRLEDSRFDSFEAAMAIAEVLLPTPVPQDLRVEPAARARIEESWRLCGDREVWLSTISVDDPEHRCYAKAISDRRYLPIFQFRHEVARAKDEASAGGRRNAAETLDAFEPESEGDVKKRLAVLFARRRADEEAYQKWVREQESEYEQRNGVSLEKLRAEEKTRKEAADAQYGDGVTHNHHLKAVENLTGRCAFGWTYKGVEIDPNVPFVSPVVSEGRRLCAEIEISPSGTGLIQVRDRDPDHGWCPSDVARITTYSVSFVPINPEAKEELKTVLERALRVLGTVPYKYDLPAGSVSAGKFYRRVSSGDDGWRGDRSRTASNYVAVRDGKLTPIALFDLDDLYALYFIIESIIEPSAQIAAAMNAARYAEERGKILTPEGSSGQKYVVADTSGYLKRSKPEDMLRDAMLDTFRELTLNNIDEAELAARLLTLAHLTLTGRIEDPIGNFPTLSKMLGDARRDGCRVMTYHEALSERTRGLLRCLLNEQNDSGRPLHAALRAATQALAGFLKEQSRDEARRCRQEEASQCLGRTREAASRGSETWDKLRRMFDERRFDADRRQSDIEAGIAGLSEDATTGRRENALVLPTHLVVADSAVETALDGIYSAHITLEWHHFNRLEGRPYYDPDSSSCNGTYRTRTKGSPLPRYELPEALKPFCPESEERPRLRLRRADPNNALG